MTPEKKKDYFEHLKKIRLWADRFPCHQNRLLHRHRHRPLPIRVWRRGGGEGALCAHMQVERDALADHKSHHSTTPEPD